MISYTQGKPNRVTFVSKIYILASTCTTVTNASVIFYRNQFVHQKGGTV